LSGYYKIVARHSGKATVVQGASTANGANAFQWTYGGSNPNDEWELRGIGSGYYRFINRHSGKDLNVTRASTANKRGRRPVHLWRQRDERRVAARRSRERLPSDRGPAQRQGRERRRGREPPTAPTSISTPGRT
jgi:hypothetical protein